jgi:hypothetical protein
MSQATDFIASVPALGSNVERTNAINYGFNSNPAVWQTLISDGAAGIVRMFVPFSPDANFGLPHGTAIPTAADIAPYLDAVALGNSLGVQTALEFLDVSNLTDWGSASAAMLGYLQMCVTETAKRGFNPELATFGPCNEWAAETNPAWQTIVNETVALFAAGLPGFCITINAGGWGGASNYALGSGAFVLPPSLAAARAIAQVHDYDASAASASHWQGLAATMEAWCAQYPGAAWRIGEAGFGGVSGPASYNAEVWTQVIAAVAQGAPGGAATFWAITNGGDWAMNASSGAPALHSELATAFQAAAPIIAAQAGPSVPTPVPTPTPTPLPTPTPTPLPTPAPAPASIITVSDPGSVVAGSSVQLAVTSSPPVAAIGWVGVSGGAKNPWYGGATSMTSLALNAVGEGVIEWTPLASGDFVKWGVSIAASQDTAPVKLVNPAPPPTPLPVPDPKLQAAVAAMTEVTTALSQAAAILNQATVVLSAAITAAG